MFARYMWVLKFLSNWCAVLLHPSHNTAEDLDKMGGLSTVFFFSNCSLGCEDELQLAYIYYIFIL